MMRRVSERNQAAVNKQKKIFWWQHLSVPGVTPCKKVHHTKAAPAAAAADYSKQFHHTARPGPARLGSGLAPQLVARLQQVSKVVRAASWGPTTSRLFTR